LQYWKRCGCDCEVICNVTDKSVLRKWHWKKVQCQAFRFVPTVAGYVS
jgi:hypothetical protein